MGKAARNRRLRSTRQVRTAQAAESQLLQRGYTGPLRVDSAATHELITNILGETEMPCRAAFLDDLFPAGSLASVASVTDDGQPVFDLSGKNERVPVLMFEPTHMLVLKDNATGTFHDHRTESLVAAGFTRVPPRAVIAAMPADGWKLYRTADGVVLHDPYGGAVANGKLTLEPEWVSAATSDHQVLVLFGPRLGIRVPPGRSAESYTAEERAKEFTRCRHDGQIIAAAVRWHGPQQDEALNWVLLREGSLGLALPLAYVPAVSFKAHGGPETFGFASFRAFAPLNEPPIAPCLAAELTATDLDLIRPGADPGLGWVCGYHAAPGDDQFTAWRQEAIRHGYILVATGNKEMASNGPDRADRAREVLFNSAAAAVPLTQATLRGYAPRDLPEPETAAQSPTAAHQEAEYMQALAEKLRTQQSFTIYVADTLSRLIDPEELQPWLTNLWPVLCQTCGEPLGSKAEISADGFIDGSKVLVSMHHSVCRPSGVTPNQSITLNGPTSSFATGWLGHLDNPGRHDFPVMVINPSCEQLLLERGTDGLWRNATLDDFAALGFVMPSGELPPVIEQARAEVAGDSLLVSITAELPAADRYQWTVKPPSHVCDQARRHHAIAVSMTTKILPTLMTPEELPFAFSDPETLVGRIPVRKAPRRGRDRRS